MFEGSRFVGLQLRSGISGLCFFLLAAVSWAVSPHLPRYDFLLLGCIAIQAALLILKLETLKELMAICLFHMIGVGLEWYKVGRGSWSYPEFAITKVMGVPLFSGFMYASVASYMLRAHDLFKLRFIHWPQKWVDAALVLVIYLHYFGISAHPGIRPLILAVAGAAFWRTQVEFTTTERRTMPMTVAFALIGTGVYLAENLCTALGVWQYPHQAQGWQPVDPGKLSAWMLLSAVSLIVVRPFVAQSRWEDEVEDEPLSVRPSSETSGQGESGWPSTIGCRLASQRNLTEPHTYQAIASCTPPEDGSGWR